MKLDTPYKAEKISECTVYVYDRNYGFVFSVMSDPPIADELTKRINNFPKAIKLLEMVLEQGDEELQDADQIKKFLDSLR